MIELSPKIFALQIASSMNPKDASELISSAEEVMVWLLSDDFEDMLEEEIDFGEIPTGRIN